MAQVRVMWRRGGGYQGEIAPTRRLIDVGTMRAAGSWIAVQLENRTRSGRDEAGNRFRPYTPEYARRKGVPRGQVDLARSGRMLREFDVVEASSRHVRIGFRSKAMEDRARYNEGMGRKFLGLDRRWLSQVRRRLVKGLPF